MEFNIFEMTAAHISEIAELEKECFSSPWSENALKAELNNDNSFFLVAYSDKVLGYIGVQEICSEAYITNIAVSGEYRKNGIGRRLLQAAVNGARSRECDFITLEVRASNKTAISLYESEGFEAAGIRKNFYSVPVENGIIYTKYFNIRGLK